MMMLLHDFITSQIEGVNPYRPVFIQSGKSERRYEDDQWILYQKSVVDLSGSVDSDTLSSKSFFYFHRDF